MNVIGCSYPEGFGADETATTPFALELVIVPQLLPTKPPIEMPLPPTVPLASELLIVAPYALWPTRPPISLFRPPATTLVFVV